LGDVSFLFTTGYSPQRQTYKGAHIPVPLELVSDRPEADETIAREVLALTKMNWNSADDHGRHPITLAFAQKVGAIMSEIPQNKAPLPGYRYYM
jgi:argonaute-like protein implicated in RNA metabolism and viral defense